MKNDKDKQTRLIIIASLLTSLFCMTIGYSAFRQKIGISQKLITTGYNWTINFNNIKETKLVGTAKELRIPILTSTKILFEIELTNDGDAVEYTFDVQNKGNINAILNSDPLIEIEPLEYAKYIDVSLEYLNGNKIKKGDLLDINTSKSMKLNITYVPNGTQKKGKDKILNVSITFIYAQK